MFYRKLLLSFLFLLLGLKAFPAIFVVTSNADSGPGTLRDALTQAAANDSTQTDYINFNLQDLSETGRTITLLTQLPDVSSNLVIDGSAQPGAKFGVSDAHVQLLFTTPLEQSLSGLAVINKHDVAIYGLYINTLKDVTKLTTLYFWKGIELRNDKNVIIGAAGKGNVMSGFYYPLIVNFPVNELEFFENLVLKDNFFGVQADGETLSVNQISGIYINEIIGTVTIGGTAAEGNLLSQGLSIDQDNNVDSTDPADYYFSTPAQIDIKNNNIGVDYLVQKGVAASSGMFLVTGDPGGKNTYHIEDNVIEAANGYALDEGNNGAPIYMVRNYIGTDRTRTRTFKTGGIFIYGATNFALGDADPADANYITNCNPVTIWPFSNVTVNKNSFYCTVGAQPMHYQGGFEFPFPVINILKISTNSVSGTATPKSSVELFYSDKCGTCSPQTYFASTTTDDNGNWQYNGSITSTVIASATLGLNTSDFTQTTIDASNLTIENACSSNGLGSIKGAIPYSAANIKWYDENEKVVGTSPDLLNVKIGKYKLVAKNGECGDSTNYFEIQNKFLLDTTAIKRTEPSCGNSSGSISGINVINNDNGAPVVNWQDQSGKIISTTSTLQNVGAGAYFLVITSADNSCTEKFGPFTLKNTTGPNIDQSKVAIQSTNCGQSTGSIANIVATGTGTLKYIWLNAQQQTVGTDKDLINQPAGTYKLEVTDDTQCGPVYTTDITIPETNGITLGESKAQTTSASCSQNNGTVTGIQITGATQYQWTDVNNKVIGTSVDLTNVQPGDYTLTASNNSCSKTSKTYHVGQQAPTQYPVYASQIYQACLGKANGGVNMPVDNLVTMERWVDNMGTTVGTGIGISNVPAGIYEVYLTDANGCESKYATFEVPTIPQLLITPNSGQVTGDQCSQKKGSITGIQVSGGRPPYEYTWLDANNNKVAASADLTGLGAGTYTFQVLDATTCGIVSQTYTIQNQDNDISAPNISNLQICSPGYAVLQVKNSSSNYNYYLYNSETGAAAIDTEASGKFKILVNANATYYVSQVLGTCESAKTPVQVSVGLSSADIANTFTPNNDGINDYWNINGIQSYPAATVQVFNRYGQKVFDSKGYSKPFDGTQNGKKLPAGVYYYIINLSTACNVLSGSLTIIR